MESPREKFDKILTRFITHIEDHYPLMTYSQKMYVMMKVRMIRSLDVSVLMDQLGDSPSVAEFYKAQLGTTEIPEEMMKMAKKSQVFMDSLVRLHKQCLIAGV